MPRCLNDRKPFLRVGNSVAVADDVQVNGIPFDADLVQQLSVIGNPEILLPSLCQIGHYGSHLGLDNERQPIPTPVYNSFFLDLGTVAGIAGMTIDQAKHPEARIVTDVDHIESQGRILAEPCCQVR